MKGLKWIEQLLRSSLQESIIVFLIEWNTNNHPVIPVPGEIHRRLKTPQQAGLNQQNPYLSESLILWKLPESRMNLILHWVECITNLIPGLYFPSLYFSGLFANHSSNTEEVKHLIVSNIVSTFSTGESQGAKSSIHFIKPSVAWS